MQVKHVPIRKEDEVQVVRGTYKVSVRHARWRFAPCWGISPADSGSRDMWRCGALRT